MKKVIVKTIDCHEISTSPMLRNTDVLWLYATEGIETPENVYDSDGDKMEEVEEI